MGAVASDGDQQATQTNHLTSVGDQEKEEKLTNILVSQTNKNNDVKNVIDESRDNMTLQGMDSFDDPKQPTYL